MSDKTDLEQFKAHAETVQALETIVRRTDGWAWLSATERQAVNVALDTVARVLHGDMNVPGVWLCGGAALTLAGEFRALEASDPPPRKVIELTPAEIQPGLDRVKWAEGLISQLPRDHEGRNSWLLNYGTPPDEPQPDADGWIEWHGGDYPLSDIATKVECKDRSDKIWPAASILRFDWTHTGSPIDIIAYRVVK